MRTRIENNTITADRLDGSQIRATIFHEEYYPEPERGEDMWNEGVSLVRYRDSYGGVELDSHDGLAAVLDRIYRDGRQWRVDTGPDAAYDSPATVLGDESEMVEYVSRYLRIFHGVQYSALMTHTGYSKSDWADIWVIAEGIESGVDPEAVAKATWEEWDAWSNGDTYSMEIETRSLTDAMDSEGPDDESGWVADGVGVRLLALGDESARADIADELGVSTEDMPKWYEMPVQYLG